MRFYVLIVALILVLLTNSGVTSAAAERDPERVSVGAYINDIQQVDISSHSYRLDAYVWFRWQDPDINPAETMEFMNTVDPADHVRTALFNTPQKMPDGSLYMIIREQGKFSAKFPLQKYPFDRQELLMTMEDSVHAAGDLEYVPDETAGASPVSLSPHIQLPGFNIGQPKMDVAGLAYPTAFGDLRETTNPAYSRAVFSIPVQRPWLATGVKIFLPILLVIFCTALVFFVHPSYVEGRLGVVITALLTLVALQLTTASGLPEVDYLLMTDKVYLLSYLFIIATMLQVVRTSSLVYAQNHELVRVRDYISLRIFGAFYIAGVFLVVIMTL